MTAGPISTERLELVPMSEAFLDAIVGGRRGDAERDVGAAIPGAWPDRRDEGFLALRLRQLREQPNRERWPPYAVVLRRAGRPMIGHAGYHGPPGANGLRREDAVEVGYSIFEQHRGRRYAQEAVLGLIERAREQGAAAVIGSAAPDNAPSLAILRKLGFVYRDAVWDEEDGEEHVFELVLPARSVTQPASPTGAR